VLYATPLLQSHRSIKRGRHVKTIPSYDLLWPSLVYAPNTLTPRFSPLTKPIRGFRRGFSADRCSASCHSPPFLRSSELFFVRAHASLTYFESWKAAPPHFAAVFFVLRDASPRERKRTHAPTSATPPFDATRLRSPRGAMRRHKFRLESHRFHSYSPYVGFFPRRSPSPGWQTRLLPAPDRYFKRHAGPPVRIPLHLFFFATCRTVHAVEHRLHTKRDLHLDFYSHPFSRSHFSIPFNVKGR